MKKKILIIDDQEEVRANIQTLLEEMKFSTMTAEDGIDGITKAREWEPDLILCDILMPEINGYTVLKKLLKSDKTKHIPFIFLSAKAEREDFRIGMGLGADDYLIQPIGAKELLNAIDIRLKKKEQLLKTNNSASHKENVMANNVLGFEENVFVPIKDGYILLKIKEIDYILSSGAYTNVYYDGSKKVLIRKLLKDWEKILPPKKFIRIHRSTIVNIHAIIKIEKWFNNSLRIYLYKYEDPILVSRRFSMKLKHEMIIIKK